MIIALAVTCGVLLLALVALVALLMRVRRDNAQLTARVEQLAGDLDAALRPRSATTPAERAVRRVVRTVDRVRTHGVGGLLQASIDDLQRWAAEERPDIVNLAAADGTVTLFFSDIEDSTALNNQLGDNTWVRVLGAHDKLIRGRVDRYRGQVVKTAGDGFMVAFRDAEAACRAALGIQRDLRKTLDPLLRVVAPVKVRIGIHTGQAVSRDGDYFGRNVAMAARIGDAASGGEIYASSAVREALDDDAAVALAHVGERELKGIPGTHQVWRVTVR